MIECHPFAHMWSSSTLTRISQGREKGQNPGGTHNLELFLQRVHKADRKELQTHLDLAIAKGVPFETRHCGQALWHCARYYPMALSHGY